MNCYPVKSAYVHILIAITILFLYSEIHTSLKYVFAAKKCCGIFCLFGFSFARKIIFINPLSCIPFIEEGEPICQLRFIGE